MRTRNSGFVLVAMMLVASVLFVAPAAGTGGESGNPCDSEYVQIHEWPYMVTVLPNGVDDTENLQCALDYGAARDWAKIMLVAGDYYTNFLEAEGFAGIFMGAGRENTRLLTLPAGPGGLDCLSRFEETGDTALLTFAASDVMVKGLTLGIGGEKACAVPDPLEGENVHALLSTTRLRVDETCPADVEHRLRVYGLGVESDFHPEEAVTGFTVGVVVAQPAADFWAGCETKLRGPVLVRNSNLSGQLIGVVVAETEDSNVMIGGWLPWHGNTIENAGYGVLASANSNSTVKVKGNDILDVQFWGVLAEGLPTNDDMSKFVVKRNKIRGQAGADGVGVLDFGPEEGGAPRIDPLIGWNKIEMVDSDYNGIFVIGTDGVIKGNKITGAAASGIMIDGIGYFDEDLGEFITIYPSQGWHVTRNWFPHFEFGLADIVLWDATEANLVECAWWGHEVLDFGVNNELIGCATAPDPFAAVQGATLDRATAKPIPARFGR